MEKQYVSDLKDGASVESVFSVKYKKPVRPYAKGFMFSVGLADKTGEIELSYFGGRDNSKVETVYNGFLENDIVFVRGYAKEYHSRLSLSVNEDSGSIRKADENESNPEFFLYTTNQDIDKMMGYLKSKIDKVSNAYFKSLLGSFFDDTVFVEKFKRSPAAMYMHHACVGGLLEHTWGVLKICETTHQLHPSLDYDLLVCGAVLHDIGKIEEFQMTSNIRISEKGMLLGHIAIGADMILKKIEAIEGFPEDLKNKAVHMILSHHGELEYGALKKPQFPEAAAVYMADLMDSQITQYIRFKKSNAERTEDFRGYSKYLGEIYLR